MSPGLSFRWMAASTPTPACEGQHMRYEIPAPDAILPACRVLPVIVVRETTEVSGILSALLDGGVGCAEITFRTDCAADAIRHAAEQFPGVCVGAGTVINAGRHPVGGTTRRRSAASAVRRTLLLRLRGGQLDRLLRRHALSVAHGRTHRRGTGGASRTVGSASAQRRAGSRAGRDDRRFPKI